MRGPPPSATGTRSRTTTPPSTGRTIRCRNVHRRTTRACRHWRAATAGWTRWRARSNSSSTRPNANSTRPPRKPRTNPRPPRAGTSRNKRSGTTPAAPPTPWAAGTETSTTTTPNGQEWTYTYDPLGRRTSKSSQSGTTVTVTFTWDTSRLAEQTTADGLTHTWDYSPGTHRPLTQTNQELGSTRFHTVITDPIGTPTELITPDGHLAWQHRTTLWGTPLPTPPDATACPLRFPGQYADPETGLNSNYHRYYDPETAHYLTPAPSASPQHQIPRLTCATLTPGRTLSALKAATASRRKPTRSFVMT
ncbi:hypothetical protein PS467_09085 [Streptomyces luomodiensis]|uniref:Uncharacterized protein n=1 Tax=Streptomyces luomodiensis TaxID=3026192 RepID=A0ABY9USE3_9ACTN|nr:RHS repeat-associated core domain-containing protein [Streptomyces sp. SCA4-21]WNE95487.1 hypothetical protein PS467_09085 [Streptomyces sp. SCA4-21]